MNHKTADSDRHRTAAAVPRCLPYRYDGMHLLLLTFADVPLVNGHLLFQIMSLINHIEYRF